MFALVCVCMWHVCVQKDGLEDTYCMYYVLAYMYVCSVTVVYQCVYALAAEEQRNEGNGEQNEEITWSKVGLHLLGVPHDSWTISLTHTYTHAVSLFPTAAGT